MLNNWKLRFILACISLLFCVFIINSTFAKYVTSIDGDVNTNIARWRILVNDTDVHTNASLSHAIAPIFYGNDFIAPNVIAPTSEGYFDLVIDSTSTDLSFSYSIDIAVSENSSVRDLVAFAYQVNDGPIINADFLSNIGGNVIRNLSENVNTVRIFIKWDDSENKTMTNHEQTDASYDTTRNPKLTVNLSFIQLNNV